MNEQITADSALDRLALSIGEAIGVVLGLCILAALGAAIYGLFTNPVATLFMVVVAFFGGLLLVAGGSIVLLPFLYLLDRLFIGEVS
ncbi:MAG: hypothetical protein ACQES2_04975 [Pseudomonadota bacterium]